MDWTKIEIWLRLGPFIAVFSTMALLEYAIPRRELQFEKSSRWINNLALIFIGSFFVRLLIPGSAVAIAMLAEQNHWGILNTALFTDYRSSGLMLCMSIVLLDFTIWYQHFLFHKIPLLWRLHRVHHSDLDMDVTTSVRFHPVEIVLSVLIKGLIVVVFGLPAIAVLVFEILLNAAAMFNHSNIRIANVIERPLRYILVTPDMHRIHHSSEVEEHNTNFGFFLSCWDCLFKTYTAEPQRGHQKMTLGLTYFRQKSDQRLDTLIIQPVKEPRID